MKLLEIGLVIVIVAFIVGYVTNFFNKDKRADILQSIGAALLSLHIIFEGYREAILLIYGIYVICILLYIINLVRRGKSFERVRPKLWKRIVVSCLGLIFIPLALSVPLYFLPQVKIPLPTGPHAIGTANYHFVDTSREELFTADPSDHRELIAKVWYPAEIGEDSKLAPYAYTAEESKLVKKNQPLFKKALVSSIADVKSHSYWKAPVSSQSENYPVLLFSPGYGASNYMYASISENLASHGYIVISMQHPHYSIIPTLFPDKRVAKGQIEMSDSLEWESSDKEMEVWVKDARFLLHELEQWNKAETGDLLSGKMDLSRIGMFGHSFGGAASAQVMTIEPKVLAGVNMDGSLFGKRIENGLAHPFLYIQASDSVAFSSKVLTEKEWKNSPHSSAISYDIYKPFITESIIRTKGLLSNGGTELVLDDASHESFSDGIQLSPILGKYVPSVMTKLNKILLQYFNKNVKSAGVN
ncbi:hypothetical protein [Paenibacillus sp. L3-i20]|uniref:alpha/beta hydrolase family protein n=1 Tax=Paenibacillus sp. L3-i20 TaxID=2905833 RepID=UPI001EDEFA32|nr:hypothetical protein [Paenibacillus sp. L3-i20]GKU76036.1 carboxylic ester hydrolase [Paenibacillus sp. L3-i20]